MENNTNANFTKEGNKLALFLTWGGHFLMNFKTTCIQNLLPLYYMLRIIQNFINFFCRVIKPLELYFVNFWAYDSSIWNSNNYFCDYFCCYSSKWWILLKKDDIKFYYHTLVCNKYIFSSLHKKYLIIIWPRIRCLLEGISFILDSHGFELHKKVTALGFLSISYNQA